MTGFVRVAVCTFVVSVAAACGDTQGPPVAQKSLIPDSAEQVLYGVEFYLNDKGVRRAVVATDMLLSYDDNTREELKRVTARFYNPAGEQEAILRSIEGSHNSRIGTMEARGDVVVVSKEGKTLNTPQLKYDPNKNEISSDSAFTLTEGETITRGVGFVSNPEMTNMRILAGAQRVGNTVKIPRK